MDRNLRIGAACAASLFLVACGGGGNSTPPPTGGTPVAVTGVVTYQRVNHNATTHALDYTNITSHPVRGATVQARAGSTSSACASGAVLTSATTAATGAYAMNVATGIDFKVCVRAEALLADAGAAAPSWDIQVRDNTASDAIYVLESAVQNITAATALNLLAGVTWSGTAYTVRTGAPFAILDSMYGAVQKILTVDATADFPALDVFWSVNNTNVDGNINLGQIGTSYYQANEIYVLGDEDNDTDEFDDHVIVHEFGHYIEDNLSRADSIGGSHSGGDLLDMRVAYGEGFGNAWSGIVTDDPVYQDSFGANQTLGFDINVETDAVSAGQSGWFSETSVAAILYDLYDATNEGNGDGIAMGLGPLWEVWTGEQRTTPAMTSIHSFLDALRENNPGSSAAIGTLATFNDVHSTDEWGADETDDGGLPTIALPVHVDYVVGQGATQYCTTNVYGEYNALGNRRFLRLAPAATGTRTFSVTATGGNDADAVLYHEGVELERAWTNGDENFQEALTAGQEYVLEVYPWTNSDGNAGTGGTNICVTVAIN